MDEGRDIQTVRSTPHYPIFLILQLRTSGPSVVSVPCIQENNVTTYQKLEEYWVKNILDISKKQNFGID